MIVPSGELTEATLERDIFGHCIESMPVVDLSVYLWVICVGCSENLFDMMLIARQTHEPTATLSQE